MWDVINAVEADGEMQLDADDGADTAWRISKKNEK